MAPGVQIALQTSPQRPRTQPPPGGPSGKLERDSVCQPPGAAPAGARAERSHKPPSPALPEQTRGGGGGWAHHKTEDSEQPSPLTERPRSRGWLPGSRFSSPPTRRCDSKTTQDPGGKVGRGCQPFRPPVSVEGGRCWSFHLSPYRTPQICCCLLAARGTGPTPRTPSEREKKKKKKRLSCSLIGSFSSSDRSRRQPPI